MSPKVRKAEVAGLFYPEEPKALRSQIEELLRSAPEVSLPGELKALIVPHAGYSYSGPVAAVGYKLLQKIEFSEPPKILLLGPAHHVAFSGAAAHPADFWETPLGRVPVISPDLPISSEGPLVLLPEAHQREHCLEVQLPFLQIALERFSIFPLVTGMVEPSQLAKLLEESLERFKLIIVSSDLSHYYSYERAREIDAVANRLIPALDVEAAERRLEACGKTAILTLMLISRGRGWKGELLDYRNSGDTSGERASVVGYGCYGFYA